MVLAGVKAELNEFGLHGDPGDPQPARGFGLVAPRLVNGPRDHRALGGFEHAGVRVGQLTSVGSGQEILHLFFKELGRGAASPVVLFNAVRTWSRLIV